MSSEAEFKEALLQFGDSVIAQQLLGKFDSSFPQSWSQEPVDSSLSLDARLDLLLKELKDWVILKAQEQQEFDGDDSHRIWGEAVGCMYAIREINRHLSEKQNI